jgi:chitin disaccharide deacetylase
MKNLIVRADDAGSSQSTNRAMLECLRAGVLKNVSVMVCPAAFDDFVTLYLAAKNLPEHDLGIHATITSEWFAPRWGSVLEPDRVSSLLDDHGYFPPRNDDQSEALLEEMLAEVAAQLAKMRAAKLEPQYLDTHMFFAWALGWLEPLGAFADREGLIFADRFEYLDVPGVWPPEPINLQRFESALRAMPDGKQIWPAHPAFADAEIAAMNSTDLPAKFNLPWRDADRRILCDPATIELLNRLESVISSEVKGHDTPLSFSL